MTKRKSQAYRISPTESVPAHEGSLEQCRLIFSDGSRCENDCIPHEQYCPDCLECGLTDFGLNK
jgi:hypothetical protein